MTAELDEELVIAHLLGAPFLAYVINLDPGNAQARLDGQLAELADPGERAFHDLIAHTVTLINMANASPDGPPSELVRRLGWIDMDREQSHANLFRLANGGELPTVPTGLNEVEAALVAIAIDYFPLTLLPTSSDQPFPGKPLISGARVAALEAALRSTNDPLLTLFPNGNDEELAYYTSSGLGYGPLWAFRVGECALATAEQMIRVSGNPEPSAFLDRVLRNLGVMRTLCTEGNADVLALVTYENAVLPAGLTLRGPRDGFLRAATERDPRPPVASATTMVLETTCNVSLSVGRMPPPADSDFWLGVSELRVESLLVSLAGLLATASQEQRGMPRQRGTRIFDPFQPYVGWYLSTPGVPWLAFPPEQLVDLEEWLLRLAEHYHPSIRVAVKRCVSAFSERPDTDDALIDLVIALENIFATRGPKLRQRMATALGNLLGNSSESREAIGDTARAVYDARSDLVHGDELADTTFGHPKDNAEHLVLQTFEVLFRDRPELIADRRGRRRLWKESREGGRGYAGV
jgi:hypothetical protein